MATIMKMTVARRDQLRTWLLWFGGEEPEPPYEEVQAAICSSARFEDTQLDELLRHFRFVLDHFARDWPVTDYLHAPAADGLDESRCDRHYSDWQCVWIQVEALAKSPEGKVRENPVFKDHWALAFL